jgi:response regulator RpfG family c-di-GMP phosphodiesterase
MLIIDDYPPGLRLLNELSRAAGLASIAASSIDTVTHAAFAQPIAGIIIDADCHSESWIDFVRRMRSKNDETESVPVFILSSISRAARTNFLTELGVTAVLGKPICVSDFFVMLERWVSPRVEALRQAQHCDRNSLLQG